MGKTLVDKIWDAHVVKTISPSTQVLYIDQHYIHEVTSPQAFSSLKQRGLPVFRPQNCLATADHNVPTTGKIGFENEQSESAVQVKQLVDNCANNHIECYSLGHKNQGIVHVIGPELGKTKPGSTIVCGDSHTSTHGAFATIAFGIGTTQVEHVLASQCLVMQKPKTMRITVNGQLPSFTTPKDVILYIISQLGSQGATGYFVEYAGSVFKNMSMEGRMTVCNMSIEMGARGGLVGVDHKTIAYLRERMAITDSDYARWVSCISDENAVFDAEKTFDGEDIYPMITVGTSPDTGIRVGQKIGEAQHITKAGLRYMQFDPDQQSIDQKVDFVFIGSCTNGRIEDLRIAAEVIQGNKIASGVTAWVVPGSQQVKQQAIKEGLPLIFTEAGFEFREPGCSACLAMNEDKIPAGSLCVSTSNRNFEGRQGPGARTILASPATAAASAIKGRITHPKLADIQYKTTKKQVSL